MIEREKRVASVHRRKIERCLDLFMCTGKGRESEKALWKRAEHKECGDPVMWESCERESCERLSLKQT